MINNGKKSDGVELPSGGYIPELEDGIRLAAYIRSTWAIPTDTRLSEK
jgi:hypothetical protein